MPTLGERIKERFNLEKQVTFYMSYHYDKTNMYIHFACIWPILITALIMAADTPTTFVTQPEALAHNAIGKYIVFNLSFIGAIVYMAWYIALDYVAGTLGAFLVFCAYLFANYFSATSPGAFGVSAWVIALPIHCACWIAQFVGHGYFERRRPALFDSLDQALITAPMFVLLEVLFSFGYRKDLYDRVMVQVRINVLAAHGKEEFEKIFGEKTPLVGSAA